MRVRVGEIFFDPNIQLFPDTYDNFIEKSFVPAHTGQTPAQETSLNNNEWTNHHNGPNGP